MRPRLKNKLTGDEMPRHPTALDQPIQGIDAGDIIPGEVDMVLEDTAIMEAQYVIQQLAY